MTGSDNSSQLHQASSNVSGSRQTASKFRLSGLTDASIDRPNSPYGSSNNLHRASSQVSLDAVGGHQNSEKWKRVSHNRPKANDSLRGSRRRHGTASSNKVSGTSDPMDTLSYLA